MACQKLGSSVYGLGPTLRERVYVVTGEQNFDELVVHFQDNGSISVFKFSVQYQC